MPALPRHWRGNPHVGHLNVDVKPARKRHRRRRAVKWRPRWKLRSASSFGRLSMREHGRHGGGWRHGARNVIKSYVIVKIAQNRRAALAVPPLPA